MEDDTACAKDVEKEENQRSNASLIPFAFMVLVGIILLSLLLWYGPTRIIQVILQYIVPEKPDWKYAVLIYALIVLLMVFPMPVVFIIIFVPGMVFGFATAVLILFAAVFTGVTLAFLLGRWALQDVIRHYVFHDDNRKAQAVLQTLENDEDTLLLLVLFRFLTLPFILKNYVPVLLKVPFWKLVVTAIPHHCWVAVLFASLGSVFKDSAELLRRGNESWDWKELKWHQMLPVAVALTCSLLITAFAYRIFQKKAADHSDESERAPLLPESDSRA